MATLQWARNVAVAGYDARYVCYEHGEDTVSDDDLKEGFIVSSDPEVHAERIREVEQMGATTVVVMNNAGADPHGAIRIYKEKVLPAVKGQRFVTPTPKDQEVRSLSGNFWDGETAITGASRGVGIEELLDYCYAASTFAQLG